MSQLDAAIGFLRRNAVAQFRAECRVMRPGAGPGTFDPDTGTTTAPAATVVYDGLCNAREMAWEGTDVGIAGAVVAGRSTEEVRLHRVELRFPHNTAVAKDDLVEMTAAPHDAVLVGETYRITDVILDAWQIVRRAIGEKVED